MSNLANTPDFDSYDGYDDELYDEVDIDDGVEYSDDLKLTTMNMKMMTMTNTKV